ncbi:MAG: CPXCG motif-containing cysteine-rich protein [Gemmatimonadota bacterium]
MIEDEGDAEQWTEEDIDSEFPLGDGTAETEAIVECPHCGEPNEIALDPGGGSKQEYVEDCQVCCRPWLMYVTYDRKGNAEVEVYASDS